jgi:Zn-dependent protease with chaperone function/tetratricopeptide (TPR) repeat protein
MLGFYAAATATMAILAILLLLGVAVVAGAARVGLSGYVADLVKPVVALLGIFARRLWLRSETAYHIALSRAEAPSLFAVVGRLAERLKVTPPESIVLEMHTGAWVRLKGFRRATGNVTLGVGYDLLAGLSVSETEAVLAHELGHMRFVQRGFSRWLNKGLARLSSVTDSLSGYSAGRRNSGKPSHLADWSSKAFQSLTVRAALLVATCSRQDEFEADLAAADIAGADALRSALLKLEPLHQAAALIPWPERLARLQAGRGYADWLVEELARRVVPLKPEELPRHSIDPYSTHPALRDRIMALSAGAGGAPELGTALELIASPDQVARRLAAEIQSVIADQERKDTRRIARQATRWSRRVELGLWHLLSAALFIIGFVLALLVFTNPFDGTSAFAAVVCLGLAAAAYRTGTYRDTRPLPVPEYGTLTTWKPFDTREALVEAEEKLVTELRTQADHAGSKRAAIDLLIDAAYEALRRRDYLRAHVASRLALARNAKQVEGSLAYAIAAASIGNREQATRTLEVVRRRAGCRSPSTCWGAAWALVMLEDWGAEGLLLRLVARQPAEPTFVALLALAQLKRNKVNTGIDSARKALALAPGNEAIAQLLIEGLLQAGRVREALEASAPLQATAEQDARGAFLMVRLRLMAHDAEGAVRWAGTLRGLDQDGSWNIALGSVFAAARAYDAAIEHFTRAVDTPFAPQANLGLAGLASIAGDRARARTHYLSALRFDKAGFTGGETPVNLFHAVINRLNALDERRITCAAWICSIPDGRFALSGCSLLVFAESAEQARTHLEGITTAMASEADRPDLGSATWRKAPDEQQPVRPVFPGVQCIVN